MAVLMKTYGQVIVFFIELIWMTKIRLDTGDMLHLAEQLLPDKFLSKQ